jgi:hypothetical protein
VQHEHTEHAAAPAEAVYEEKRACSAASPSPLQFAQSSTRSAATCSAGPSRKQHSLRRGWRLLPELPRGRGGARRLAVAVRPIERCALVVWGLLANVIIGTIGKPSQKAPKRR